MISVISLINFRNNLVTCVLFVVSKYYNKKTQQDEKSQPTPIAMSELHRPQDNQFSKIFNRRMMTSWRDDKISSPHHALHGFSQTVTCCNSKFEPHKDKITMLIPFGQCEINGKICRFVKLSKPFQISLEIFLQS